jgi:hypothetical protein
MNPKFSYSLTDPLSPHVTPFGANARVIELGGRRGINFQSIRGRIALTEHTLNSPQGAISLWVMATDDLSPATRHPQHALSNPHSANHVLISDREVIGDTASAHFCLFWECDWHPVFTAKFCSGTHLQNAWGKVRGAEAMAGHFEFHRLEWYLLTVRWDDHNSLYEIYANGICVASADTSTPGLVRLPCGPVLYLGSPTLVISEVHFFDQLLSPEEIRAQPGCSTTNAVIRGQLERTFEGKDLPTLTRDESGWLEKLYLPLRDKADYQKFFLQGCGTAVHFTDEGFRICTPGMEEYVSPQYPVRSGYDMTRMYLWTRDVFEGDLTVSFEFKLHGHGGLCLLMTQAAGMQGEDFLSDYYPQRVDGSMSVVCWEDVRNYHWEFYREMLDVPNHLVSHACLKNPWFKPMSFQIENRRWELDRWYRLDYVQEGSRIRGAINGIQVMDVTDDAFTNNGPVLLNGRVALRCMMRTDMTFRNFRIQNRPHFDVLPSTTK